MSSEKLVSLRRQASMSDIPAGSSLMYYFGNSHPNIGSEIVHELVLCKTTVLKTAAII